MNTLDTPNGQRIRAELQHWFGTAQIKLEHGGLTLRWPELDGLTIRVHAENRYKKDTVCIYVQGKEGLSDLVALSQLKRQTLVQASGRPSQIQPLRVALAVANLYAAVEPYYLHSQGVLTAALKALLSVGCVPSGQFDLLKLGDLSFALTRYWGNFITGGRPTLHLRLVPQPVNCLGSGPRHYASYSVRLGDELDSAEFLQQVCQMREGLAKEEQDRQARDSAHRAAKSLEITLRAAYPDVPDEVIRAWTENEVVITARCSEDLARKILDLLTS